MANENQPNQGTEQDTDVSKAQAAQQPQGQASEQETGEQGQQAELDQDRSGQPDDGQQGDTATRQRTDIEGENRNAERSEAEGGFVGSQSDADTSSELVDDDQSKRDSQGAPEGK